MKKIFAVALVAMMTMTANAQVYVGGGIGFETTSYDGSSETFFKIMPEVGYNINDNWAVGIVIGYGEYRTKLDSKLELDNTKIKAFEVSPYARYTFAKFDKINLFVDGGVDYTHADADGHKNNTFGVGLKPGVAVNLNDKLSFVAHAGFLGYQYSKDDHEGAKAANSFGLNIDASSLSFGLYYNF